MPAIDMTTFAASLPSPDQVTASIRSTIEAILAFIKSLDPEKVAHAVDVRARELLGSLRAFDDDPRIPPEFIVLSREHPYFVGLGFLFICEPTLILAPAALVLRVALGVVLLPFKILLWCCGFGRKGPRRDSWAASAQRTYYGATVPAGSSFARAQSVGARPSNMGGGLSLGITCPFLGIFTIPMWAFRLAAGWAGLRVLGAEWGWWDTAF